MHMCGVFYGQRFVHVKESALITCMQECKTIKEDNSYLSQNQSSNKCCNVKAA